MTSVHRAALLAAAFGATALAASARPAAAANPQRVRLAVTLKLHHAADLDALIARQSDPASPGYAHFLTAAQFRDTYGPTAAEYAATLAALRASGFTVERTFASRTAIDVSAAPAAAERALHVRLVSTGSGRAQRYIADAMPRVDATLPAVATVTGIEPDVAHALVQPTRAAGAAPGSTGGGPIGPDDGYAPVAITRGYDLPVEHGFDGTGTTVANVLDATADNGLQTFLSYYKIAAAFPTPTVVPVDGGSGESDDGPAADAAVEWLYATAPGAHVLEYAIPSLANQNVVDALTQVASDNRADVLNLSFGACELNTAFAYAVLPIIKQLAAEGIAVESAAFGGAAYCGVPGVALPLVPADSADGLAVGGENVVEDGTNTILDASGFISSGGGVSVLVPVPVGQKPIKGVNGTGRNVPDIAFSAVVNGAGASYNWGGFWAGGQGFVNNPAAGGMLAEFTQMTHHRLGAFNQTLYDLFAKYGYGTVIRDIRVGCNGLIGGVPVCAKPDFDVTSGIGSVDAFRLGSLLP
jgi:subtilase family serine protease